MDQSSNQYASLQAPVGEAFLPVVTSFAETTALALGLAQSEALDLRLAAEEVFYHVCRIAPADGGWVEVRCSGGGYYAQLDFTFPSVEFDMRAFNICTSISMADDDEVEQMGLFLASRSVDRFRMSREDGRRLKLSLVKEKAYPSWEERPAPSAPPLERFTVRTPDPGELKLLAELVNVHYRDAIIPDFLKYPGKLVDMAGSGEYRAAVAAGPSGEVGGAVLWRGTGSGAVEWYGPYLFNQDPDSPVGASLIDNCIAAIARTPAVALVNRFPTPEFPREEFEYLGHVTHHAPDGTASRRDAWARLMQEDPGSAVWAHPRLHDYLRQEYARLVLPREIRTAKDQGERRPRHSVLMSAFDRLQGSVTLQPVWWGEDSESNLGRHLELFQREGVLNVFFTLDLGRSQEAGFTPAILRNGFEPRMILPYAGAGDLVVFQHVRPGGASS